MKTAEDIRSVTELKTGAAKMLRTVGETRRPIVITQSGEPRGVLMDFSSFQEMRDATAQRVVDTFGMVDEDAEAARRDELHGEHVDAGDAALDDRRDLARERFLTAVDIPAATAALAGSRLALLVDRCASLAHIALLKTCSPENLCSPQQKWAPRAHLVKPVSVAKPSREPGKTALRIAPRGPYLTLWPDRSA